MKVQGPSKKLQAVNEALANLPPSNLTSEQARQQVLQHHLESQQELKKSNFPPFQKPDSNPSGGPE